MTHTNEAITQMYSAVDGSSTYAPYQCHSDFLAPGYAEKLNDAFDFVVVGALHGFGEGTQSINAPCEQEYQVVADAVAGLDPLKGDKLFVEGPGAGDEQLFSKKLAADPAALLAAAEQDREEKKISTFRYAGALAVAKGVPTRYADMSRSMVNHFLAATAQPDVKAVAISSEYGPDLYQLRNQQAVYTAKDDAIVRLHAVRGRSEKPTSMLLFGEVHVWQDTGMGVSIPEIFAAKDLEVRTQVLPNLLSVRIGAYAAMYAQRMTKFFIN
jgi:hypothetical protein